MSTAATTTRRTPESWEVTAAAALLVAGALRYLAVPGGGWLVVRYTGPAFSWAPGASFAAYTFDVVAVEAAGTDPAHAAFLADFYRPGTTVEVDKAGLAERLAPLVTVNWDRLGR